MSVKCKKDSENYFMPRLDVRLYIPFLALIVLLILFVSPYILRTGDFGPLLGIAIVTLLSVDLIYSYTRYRVWWQNDVIYQRTSDKIITSIAIKDIKKIRQETSTPTSRTSSRRPVSRMAIYGDTLEGPIVIDVSLIHFKMEDVRKLMKMIYEKRPDLEKPRRKK